MLGSSVYAAAFSNSRSPATSSISLLDVVNASTTALNIAACSRKPSCSLRPSSQTNTSGCKVHILNYVERNWSIHSVSQVQPLQLEDEEKKTWEECKAVLSELNFSIDETDLMLKKAFGWVHSPYWGEERAKELPKNEIVTRKLDYLKGLGLSDDDLYKLLKKFPEVLGCDLNDEIKANIGTLEKEWGIKGKSLRNLLLRNPKVLGYNVDCKGDCMAKCTRCWVRF